MDAKDASKAADIVAALWRLGAPKGERMRDSHCIIDGALLELVTADLPFPMRKLFSFGLSPHGMCCREWPAISARMEELGLAERDGTTYLYLTVMISEDMAHQLLLEHGIPRNAREPLSKAFFEAAKHYESKLMSVS